MRNRDNPIWIKSKALEMVAIVDQPAEPSPPPEPWLYELAKQILELLPPAPPTPPPSAVDARLLEVFRSEYERLHGKPVSQFLADHFIDMLEREPEREEMLNKLKGSVSPAPDGVSGRLANNND